MAFLDQGTMYRLILILPGLLLSLTIHEFAHARTALAFGDPTAKHMGRVSLNPLRHLDPMGTIMIIVTSMAGVGFGWGKPVPVNTNNLHPRRLGDAMVSLAGPASNIFLAIVTALLLKVCITVGPEVLGQKLFMAAGKMLLVTMALNIALCVFNLLPIFPLDGHHIVREMLPTRMQAPFMRWQMRFGFMVLLGLVFGPRLLSMLRDSETYFDPLGDVFLYVVVHFADLMGVLEAFRLFKLFGW